MPKNRTGPVSRTVTPTTASKIAAHIAAGVYLLSSTAKILDWPNTVEVMASIVPVPGAGTVLSLAVIGLEVLLALALLMPGIWDIAGLLSMVMLSVFTLAAAAAKQAGLITSCPCFGEFFGGGINVLFYLRNAVLIGISAVWAGGAPAAPLTVRHLAGRLRQVRIQNGISFLYTGAAVLLLFSLKLHLDSKKILPDFLSVNEHFDISRLAGEDVHGYPERPDWSRASYVFLYAVNPSECSSCLNEIHSFARLIEDRTAGLPAVAQSIVLLDSVFTSSRRYAMVLDMGLPVLYNLDSSSIADLRRWQDGADQRQLIVWDRDKEKIIVRIHLLKGGATPLTYKQKLLSLIDRKCTRRLLVRGGAEPRKNTSGLP